MSTPERIYEKLLRIYPAEFRRRFAASMSFAFATQADEARERGGLAYAGFWMRSVAHVVWFGVVERVAGARSGGDWRHGLITDVSHASRRLRRSPGFAFAAVATLALGIGATTAIFSVVHGVVLNPLPYPQSDRLVSLQHSAPGAALDLMGVSLGTYVHYREYNRVFDEITVYRPTLLTLMGNDDAVRLRGAVVSQDFFDIFLAGPPLVGRAINDDDQEPGAPRVAVISQELWQQRFDGDPQAIGRSVQVDGLAVELIGVLPASFDVPSIDTQMWLPQKIDPETVILGGFGRAGVAKLKDGVSPRLAHDELERLIPTMSDRFNPVAFELIVASGGLTSIVAPLRESIVGDVEQMLWILLGTVTFVLAIACANVANLFLVRAEAQRSEIAVRAALGAGKTQIARHHLSESIVLGIAGGGLGVLLAFGGVRSVVQFGPEAIPRLHEVGIHIPILAFAAAISLGAGLSLGLIPIIRQRRSSLSGSIGDGGRNATQSRSRHRARNVLVVAQISLALVLMVGAGLMVRTFWHLRSVDPGFDADSALVFRVGLPQALYPEPELAMQFQQQIIERVSALPGVTGAGATTCLPLDGCDGRTPVYAEGVPFEAGAVPPSVDVRGATSGYFTAMRIPLIEGRNIGPADHLREPASAVVSRNLAERLWPGESAIGKRIHPDVPDEPPFTVVGVVGNVVASSLETAPPEMLHLSFLGPYGYTASPYVLTFVARTDMAPVSIAAAVRNTIHDLDPNVALADMRPLQQVLNAAGAPTAFAMLLLVVAGLVSLTLGAVGIYGVLSYVVSQRVGEIGVRMALGAEGADVRRMILHQGASVVALGVAIGLGGAFALTRLMTAVLFGVSPGDPLTYAAVALALAALALFASWIPARRASRVDPIVALRAG